MKETTSLALVLLALAGSAQAEDPYRYQRDQGFFTTLFMDKEMAVLQHRQTQEECGSCHWALLPGLLPERSWNRILEEQGEHFGENLDLDPEVAQEIRTYLITHAAEFTPSKVSVHILDSIPESESPLRVSETSFWKKKHEEMEEEKAFGRESVKSPSNCVACHTEVERDGDFDEHRVEVPIN
ncbi:MAG: cytochrome C [bacterium]